MVRTFDIIKCDVLCFVGAGSQERQKKNMAITLRVLNRRKSNDGPALGPVGFAIVLPAASFVVISLFYR